MILKTEMIKIYFPMGGEKGGSCFNNLNTLKLNHVQKMPIWYSYSMLPTVKYTYQITECV